MHQSKDRLTGWMKTCASETGCSGLVHWDDPGGWDGGEVSGGFRMGNTCAPVADSCRCLAKSATIL